jgi:hypothetical protein
MERNNSDRARDTQGRGRDSLLSALRLAKVCFAQAGESITIRTLPVVESCPFKHVEFLSRAPKYDPALPMIPHLIRVYKMLGRPQLKLRDCYGQKGGLRVEETALYSSQMPPGHKKSSFGELIYSHESRVSSIYCGYILHIPVVLKTRSRYKSRHTFSHPS